MSLLTFKYLTSFELLKHYYKKVNHALAAMIL